MIVYDATAPAETYTMGPGEAPMESQRNLVHESLTATHKPDVHPRRHYTANSIKSARMDTTGAVEVEFAGARRTYGPGEVEEIGVAAVVREALWGLIARRDVEEMPIEALVDEAAMAAARVMVRALGESHGPAC